ncbi:sigma-70 family RNA polymerase sigma factor [Streptomyces sp. NPDC002262]|uniref:RNA polymerase sigma factor n=1 Tax=Streptomyces sp. NPDC002262 TaxID=3154414 RepID=UPI00331CE14D
MIYEVPTQPWSGHSNTIRVCALEADFTQFVEETRDQLVRWFSRRRREYAGLSEDFVQAAYLKLWGNWAVYYSYDPEHKKGLAYKTVNSVFYDYARVKSNKHTPDDRAGCDVVDGSDIEAELIAAEQSRELMRALGKLPEIIQDLIQSVYFNGNTVAAFADIAGLHPKQASRYHAKAKLMLREILGER